MFEDFWARRSQDAPQPKALLAVVIWAIALYCLFGGSSRIYGWCMIGVATVNSLYVARAFWEYYGGRKAR